MAQRGGHERRVRHVAFPTVNRNGSGRLIRLECVAYLDRHDHPQTPDRRFDEVIRRERGRNGDVNPPFTFFHLRSGDVKTSCTPVAIITGAPEVFSNDANKADDQKDLIDRIRKLPAERLLPRPSGFARVVSSASQYVNDAMRELMDLIRDGT